MPPGAESASIIHFEDSLATKATTSTVLTIGGLFAAYRERLTVGAREANTHRVAGIHARHPETLTPVL
jgi:hypothetical protein